MDTEIAMQFKVLRRKMILLFNKDNRLEDADELSEDFMVLKVKDINPNFRTLNLIMLIMQGKTDDPRLTARADHVRDLAIRETCA